MRITVLTVAGCPNGPVVAERLTQVLDGRHAEVERIEVEDPEQATRLGMTGSPTVLIDGVDPFAVPGAAASLSCRLYRGPDGRVEGAPSLAGLRRALGDADAADCDPMPIDAAGRAGRGRLAPPDGGLRSMQRAVLHHFADTGRAPSSEDLEAAATASGRAAGEVVAELAAEDSSVLDDHGRIRGAYPFSAVPTAHRVRLSGGIEVWAMCAIDALGIPGMLGTDAVITSTDPVTGDPITVTSVGGRMTWQPSTALVHVGQRSCAGPAADVTCGALNFFTSRRAASSWARAHPEYTGRAVDQACAEDLGRSVFGHLLTAAQPTGARTMTGMRIRTDSDDLPDLT